MLFIYLFLERGKGREKEGEKHRLVASHRQLTWDRMYNPGMFPNWESNQWPFTLQDNAQPTEPHRPGLNCAFLKPTRKLFEYFYTICSVKAASGLLSEVKPRSKQNMDIDFRTSGQCCIKKGHMLFYLLKEYLYTSTGGKKKDSPFICIPSTQN